MIGPIIFFCVIALIISWFIAAKEALDLDWLQTIVTVILGWVVLIIITLIGGAILGLLGWGAGALGGLLQG